MFGKHPYNRAVNQFRQLRRYSQDSPKYKKALFEVIRLTKEALRKNKRDGDAHVLLANAFYLAAFMDFTSDNVSRYLPLAAAVIFEWKSSPMYTKDKEIGNKIYYGTLDALRDWMDSTKPEKTIQELHSEYYQQSLV